MKLNLKQYGAVVIMTLATSISSADQSSLGELVKNFKATDKICVGYKASKKVPIMGYTDVIGINCSDVSIERKDQSEIQISLIPKFDSDNGMRDDHVLDLLGGDKKAPVVVSISLEGLTALPTNETTLKGSISILDQKTPVSIQILKLNDGLFGVQFQTRFSDLKIERPKIGPFGIGGSVNEDLILFGQITANEASILLQEKK